MHFFGDLKNFSENTIDRLVHHTVTKLKQNSKNKSDTEEGNYMP